MKKILFNIIIYINLLSVSAIASNKDCKSIENKLSKEYTVCLKNKAISEGKDIKTKIVNEDNKEKVKKFTSSFKEKLKKFKNSSSHNEFIKK